MERTIALGFTEITVSLSWLGEDLLLTVAGGAPHIGCAVLAVPRQSLADAAQVSCTASVLNVTGHKDEAICRYLAEKACKKYRTTVLCTGGVHLEQITPEQIDAILTAIRSIEL